MITIPRCETCPAKCDYELDARTKVGRQTRQLVDTIVAKVPCQGPQQKYCGDGMEGFNFLDCGNPNMGIAQRLIEIAQTVHSTAPDTKTV